MPISGLKLYSGRDDVHSDMTISTCRDVGERTAQIAVISDRSISYIKYLVCRLRDREKKRHHPVCDPGVAVYNFMVRIQRPRQMILVFPEIVSWRSSSSDLLRAGIGLQDYLGLYKPGCFIDDDIVYHAMLISRYDVMKAYAGHADIDWWDDSKILACRDRRGFDILIENKAKITDDIVRHIIISENVEFMKSIVEHKVGMNLDLVSRTLKGYMSEMIRYLLSAGLRLDDKLFIDIISCDDFELVEWILDHLRGYSEEKIADQAIRFESTNVLNLIDNRRMLRRERETSDSKSYDSDVALAHV